MEKRDTDQKPPVFGSWTRWYVFILLVLAVQIILYWWLTKIYL